jgi:hypothetical protein
MTDIVERLKERANWCLSGPFITVEGSKIYTEAADEIERYRSYFRCEMVLENARHLANPLLAEENKKLIAALKDAQTLIDNDLVGPWMAKHKLDEILK